MPVYEKPQLNLALRVNLMLAAVILVFAVLLLRLWYLQVLQGEHFRTESENNRIRTVFVPAPRGMILDRNGVVLAKNRPLYNVELIREDSPDPDATLRRLAQVIQQDPDELLRRVRSLQRRRRRFEPQLILRDVDREMVARVLARKHSLPGITIGVLSAREYVYGEFAAHTIGYIREISAQQLSISDYSGYRQGELVGQFGIERSMERWLHGMRGTQKVIVNAMGVRIGEKFVEAARTGHNVRLTLDHGLQRVAEEALGDKEGAIVALDPNTGEVLAMTSRPGFDPNIFSGELDPAIWRQLSFGEDRLGNKAVQGTYALGSVFKFVIATAALAEGVIGRQDRVTCAGSFRVGSSRPFMCWRRTGHGALALHDAMKVSCNVYFYTVGQRLGIDRIHDYATRFGFGRPVGLGLQAEAPGLVPSTQWKRETFRNPADQKWYPGETPSVAIGQGALTVTPMQVARALAAVANGGRVLRPHLVLQVQSQDGHYDDLFGSDLQGELGVEPGILADLRKSLAAVVNEPGGTGGRANLNHLGVTVAGKTGTAQRKSTDVLARFKVEDNAWFAAFAPLEKPELVVVAIVVGGGGGGANAAPLVRQVMESFFSRNNDGVG